MKIFFKKALFVFVGLTVIGAGFFFGKPNVVEASVKDGQKFDDWVVACVKDDQKKQTCFLTQSITKGKDDKAEVLAVYQIGYFNNDKKLKMIQILPLGVNLQSGTYIISAEKLIAPGKFALCIANGCQSIVDISDADLALIIANTNNAIGYMGADAKQVNVPISNKGLKEGLEALSANIK